MSHTVRSFSILTNRGSNIMDPDNYSYKALISAGKKSPSITDFHHHDQRSYNQFLDLKMLKALLVDPANTVHIQFNHGARKGSIARLLNPTELFGPDGNSSYNRGCVQVKHGSELKVQWDDGKTWSCKLNPSIDTRKITKDEFHMFLINYEGPTVREFEKKARVKLPPAQNPDAYGRIIEVGHWVMDNRFRIGRVKRISEKGTMWIKFVAQNLGDFKSKPYEEQFGRSSTEVLILELPEGFEVTSTIMDNDVTDFEIVPTFRFGYPDQ